MFFHLGGQNHIHMYCVLLVEEVRRDFFLIWKMLTDDDMTSEAYGAFPPEIQLIFFPAETGC